MTIHYEERGDPKNRTIVFVHGSGGSSATWFLQLRELSEDLHIVAIELNGHGKSPDKCGEDTIDCYLDDIDLIVKQFDRPILAGHSMGGALTQLYALEKSDLLSGIILIGTGSKLRVAPMIFGLLQTDFDSYVSGAAHYMFDESTSDEMISASLTEIRKCDPIIISRDYYACDGFDIMEKVSEISIPTLIIVGENDKLTPVKYSQYLADQIQGSHLKVVEKAGHSVMFEQADIVNSEIRSWIKVSNLM
ncbi:MAG: alpha/beta fold hydrolase [Candidatus Thorarchaeota archaeon]